MHAVEPLQTDRNQPAAAGSTLGKPALILASQSPRRQQLLREAGFSFTTVLPPMDDAHLCPGPVEPRRWVAALAYLKARAVQSMLACPDQRPAGVRADQPLFILAADTIVIKDQRLIGKPSDENDARHILRTLSAGRHEVMTGVAIVEVPALGSPVRAALSSSLDQSPRTLFVDCAHVHVGELGNDRIEAHVASGAWRGKAGGYNIFDQLNYNWPLHVEGDPTTVAGLPMQRVVPILSKLLTSFAGDLAALSSRLS